MKKWLDRYESGGLVSKNSLNRNVTCSNCGWSWKLSDGGLDPMTCHKCGGDIKMKHGGELDEYKDRGQVNFKDQLYQQNRPVVDNTAAPIVLPGNLFYDKTRVVNSSSAGLNKFQLKEINQNLKNNAFREKQAEIENYKAAELFHNNNPVAKLLGTRSAPASNIKPTAKELAYGAGAGINEFYDVPGIGIANDFVNPLSLVSKGIISPWMQAPLQAQQSDSYLPYAGAALSTALTYPMVRPASIAAKTILNPANIYRGALGAGKYLTTQTPLRNAYKYINDLKKFKNNLPNVNDKTAVFELATSPKTLKALSQLDDPIAQSMISDYVYNFKGEKLTYNSIDDFRLNVKKAMLNQNRIKKLYSDADFTPYGAGMTGFLLKDPKKLEQFIIGKKWYNETIKNRDIVSGRLVNSFNKKINLINQNPLFKNIIDESPQYIDEVYEHLSNPKMSNDDFVTNLVKQANTFTRSVRRSSDEDLVENILEIKGTKNNRETGNNYQSDVEGFPVSMDYGPETYAIFPNEASLKEIQSIPLEQRWAKRSFDNLSTHNPNVKIYSNLNHDETGVVNFHSDVNHPYNNFGGKRLQRAANQGIREVIDYYHIGPSVNLKKHNIPSLYKKYFYNRPQHFKFGTDSEHQILTGFDTKKLGSAEKPFEKYLYHPGFTHGYKNGGLVQYQDRGEVLTPAQQVALANSLAKNTKRITTSAPIVPTIRQGYAPTPYSEALRNQRNNEYARHKAMQNSDLAKTFASFTPGGDNVDAGVIGAETFANLNPVMSGPILSASRLAPAIMHPTNNAYWGADRSIGENALGALGAFGDVTMLSPYFKGTLPKISKGLPRVLSEGQPYEGAPHIYEDMVPINGRYQPRTVITDAGVKNEILGLEATPIIPLNQIEYPVTSNKFLYGPHNSFGKMEKGVVTDTYRGMPPGTNTYTSTLPSYTSFPNNNFKSEIDWSKWNKEIPDNKVRMDEYNIIEQISKTNGTWMKNPDGSAFQGTPEQFVQTQSKNWIKAYGNKGLNSVNRVFRGVGPTNSNPDFSKGFIEGDKAIFTADKNLAKSYIHGSKNDKILSSSSNLGDAGYFDLVFNKGNQINYNTMLDDWTNINLSKGSNKLNLEYNLNHQKKMLDRLEKEGKEYNVDIINSTKQRINQLQEYINDYDKIPTNTEEFEKMKKTLGHFTTTDNIADYITNTKLNNITLQNIIDGGLGDVTIVNNRPGNYLKSIMGNNGNFDIWNNPNIYKTIVPAAIGAGALNQKQQGGPIVTNRGQWDYPGQTTIIPSNNITMQGVPYPVVGVDNTGHTKMMQPGMDYTFPGQYVTEYPMMQPGGQKNPPIYVTDPNDARLRSYQDSSALYHSYLRNLDRLKQLGLPVTQTDDKPSTLDYRARFNKHLLSFPQIRKKAKEKGIILEKHMYEQGVLQPYLVQGKDVFDNLVNKSLKTPKVDTLNTMEAAHKTIKPVGLDKVFPPSVIEDTYDGTRRKKREWVTDASGNIINDTGFQEEGKNVNFKSRIIENTPLFTQRYAEPVQPVELQQRPVNRYPNAYNYGQPYQRPKVELQSNTSPNMQSLHPQYMQSSPISMQGQPIQIQPMVFPQQHGRPVYGPGNTIIGYSNDNMKFNPAYQYTGAPNNQFNLQDKELLNNPELLKQYIYNQDSGYHYKGGGQKSPNVAKPVYQYTPQNLVAPSFNNLGQTTYSTTTPTDVKKAEEDYKKGKAYVNKQNAKAIEFHKKWMTSPMYKEMLYNSDPVNAKTIEKNRWDNFNNFTSVYNPIQPYDDPYVGGASYSNTGNIEFYPNGVQDNVSNAGIHEFSHSIDRPTKGLRNTLRNIPDKDINKMKLYSNFFNTNPGSSSDLSNWTYQNDPVFYEYVAKPTETRARLSDIRQKASQNKLYDPFTQKVTPEILKKILNFKFEENQAWDPLYQLQNVYSNDEIMDLLNSVSKNNTDNNLSIPYAAFGGQMIKRADGSYSKRGLWDNIRDNRGSGKNPTKQMLEQERKINNKYQKGGEEHNYWRTGQPMVNDPSMDAISKVLLQRNQNKNFMQRAAGFGNQNGIPTRYIDGQDPDSNNMSNLLMGFGDNQVFPTIIQTAPSQLSYQPNQTQEYITAPSWDIADYFAAKGYKRAANDMYGMNYKQGGSVTLNAGGEQHRIYVKSTNRGEGDKGHIMVNHPTMDKGMWDTIDLTQKAGAKTIAQGVAATKKWHRENPYMKQEGGEEKLWYYPKEVNMNEGTSYYNPPTETFYINPNNNIENPEIIRQHELYHHLQNINGGLQLPQYYSGPLKKPNMMANDELQGSYYNRRVIDEKMMYDKKIKKHPDWQFIPRDIIYNPYNTSLGTHVAGTDEMMYEEPSTVEGEAYDYQNYVTAGGDPMFANGGYVVRRSHDRKGKTHVVTGPDGTKKYFGDPNMGERGKSKYGKEAFYARHKSNLAKNPYFRAYARATWEEGGEIPLAQNGVEKNNQSYQIQKGDTLSNISTKYNVPLNTLANVNNIQNPNLIKTGNQLSIPKKFDRELKYEEIPTIDNKKIVIDNFSPHYDYIIEGDKTYYKTKSGKTWADISDNNSARTNLLNFINKNNYWGGYGSNEKEKYLNPNIKSSKTLPVYNIPMYDEIFNPKKKVVVTPVKKENNYDQKINPYTITPSDAKRSLYQGDISYGASPIQGYGVNVNTPFNMIDNAFNKIGNLYQTAVNGIKRKYATHTGNDNDFAIQESLIPKSLQQYYSQKIPGDITTIDVPDNSGRQYKQEILPVSNITFGVRNRGEYKDINTEGLEITSFNPFNNKPLPNEASVLALDPNGNLHTGQYKDFKNNNGYLFSRTFKNNIVDFSESSGKNEYIDGAKSGNPKYKQPKVKVLNDQGKIIDGSLNILVKGDDKKDYYGSIQGGRILFVNPTTKEQYLVAGSVDHIKKKFKELKGDNKYLEAYTLDNGTYSRGLSYKDKKLTKDRLKAYDLENTSGGNGLYIVNYNQPINKYPENYLQTPNVRTTKDDSYKKGHALKNEIKNIVLHHTAYTNPLTNEEEVRKQYMSPGANTSHVVIQENGKRTIYASPEQVTFHAGESKWKNRDNVNDFSIGVEFQGDTNKQPLTQSQIESFIEYYTPIAKKYNLSVKDIITHQMIAPGRKPDITDKEYKKILNYMKSKGYKKQGGQIMAIGGQSTLNPIVKKDNRNWLEFLKN